MTWFYLICLLRDDHCIMKKIRLHEYFFHGLECNLKKVEMLMKKPNKSSLVTTTDSNKKICEFENKIPS